MIFADGTPVVQGGVEDKATWLTCGAIYCGFTGPHVGLADGKPLCMGSCGGTVPNPKAPRFRHEFQGDHELCSTCGNPRSAEFHRHHKFVPMAVATYACAVCSKVQGDPLHRSDQ